jgi:hypothetical protein
MAAPPSGGVILVSLYHKAEDFASEETGRRGQPVVEALKLGFISDKPQPRRVGDRATATKSNRLPSLGKGAGNFGV